MITCTFEDGGTGNLRHVVADILIIDGNKILLGKRSPNLVNPNKWGLAGGYLDRDETIVDAVHREVEEETGYRVKIESLLAIADSPRRKNDERQNVAFVFVTKSIEKIGKADSETSEVKWFDLDNLPKAEEMAFHHLEQIELYKRYLKEKFPLPFIKNLVP